MKFHHKNTHPVLPLLAQTSLTPSSPSRHTSPSTSRHFNALQVSSTPSLLLTPLHINSRLLSPLHSASLIKNSSHTFITPKTPSQQSLLHGSCKLSRTVTVLRSRLSPSLHIPGHIHHAFTRESKRERLRGKEREVERVGVRYRDREKSEINKERDREREIQG